MNNDIESKCFICGIDKYEFELKGNGWKTHKYAEHSVWAYLAYLLYIKRKLLSECDGIEKDVK